MDVGVLNLRTGQFTSINSGKSSALRNVWQEGLILIIVTYIKHLMTKLPYK